MLRIDPWSVVEEGIASGPTVAKHETIFFTGNGYVGVRGSTDEEPPVSQAQLLATPLLPISRSVEEAGPSSDPSALHSSSAPRDASNLLTKPVNGNSSSFPGQAPNSNDRSPGATPRPGGPAAPPPRLRATFVNGFYEERPVKYPHTEFSFGSSHTEAFIVSVPDAIRTEIYVGTERFAPEESNTEHERVLNMRDGCVTRRALWTSTSGRRMEVTFIRAALFKHSKVVLNRVTVKPLNFTGTEVRVVTTLQAPAQSSKVLSTQKVSADDINGNTANTALHMRTRRSHMDVVVFTQQEASIMPINSTPQMSHSPPTSLGATPNAPPSPPSASGPQLGSSLTQNPQLPASLASFGSTPLSSAKPPLKSSRPHAMQPVMPSSTASWDDRVATTTFHAVVPEGHQLQLDKYCIYCTSEDEVVEELGDLAATILDEVRRFSFDELLKEQSDFLEKFWLMSDVVVHSDSDKSLQGTIRFNLLQLLMSAGRTKGTNFGIKGLTGEFFGGHYGWDSEIFILPFFTYTQRDISKSLIEFRIATLPEALNRAMDLELPRGALYPWRTINGQESTISTVSCTMQLHINADIAYAIKQFYEVSGDEQLMRDGGAAVVLTTALVWIQWGTWDRGSFHLRNVTGPDEYNVLVNDNCYTNLMAQCHLEFAARIGELMIAKYPDDWQDLSMNYMVTEEDLSEMRLAAEKIDLPFDSHNKVHLQDESFRRKKEWRISGMRGTDSFSGTVSPSPVSPNSALMNQYHPLTVYRHRVCKQADVILAQTLLGERFTRDEKRRNFDYYERITSHDSTLTAATFSIGAAELGLRDKAYRYFEKSLKVDTENLMGNTGAGIHAASLAGSWSCIAMGFAGMRNVRGVLHFDPWLPDEWSAYAFNIHQGRATIRVSVERRAVTYTAQSTEKVYIVHEGTRVHLAKGKPVSLKLQRDIRSIDFDAVVFDINAIIKHVQEDHYSAWKEVLDPILNRHSLEYSGTTAELSQEQYLAYLRHHPYLSGKKYTGLQKLLTIRGINLPVGDPRDSPSEVTIHGLIATKLAKFREIAQKKGRMSLRPGAQELIKDLRANGVGIGCVSSSHNGQWMLQQTPLFSSMDFFIDSVQGDELGLNFKPEAQYYLHAAERLQAAPARTVLIVDSIMGHSKHSLQQFGAVLCTEGIDSDHTEADLLSAGADAYLHSLEITTEDVDALIEQSNRPSAQPTVNNKVPRTSSSNMMT